MPFFHCDLTGGLNRLAFSTADDPFYKTSESKYYPEAVVISAEGKILTRINPDNRSSEDYHMTFNDDVRDPVLKINDDRKIQISFNQIKEPGTMILLTVRQFVPKDGRTIGKEGEFDRAWFRLSNEETNQTLDYCMINKMELPEEYQELIPNEDEEEAPPFRNSLTYIAGAMFLDESRGSPIWVFESYKNILQAKDFRFDTGVILVEPEVSKVNEKRTIKIQPNLKRWLEQYPIEDYPILPTRRFRDLWVDVRKERKLTHDVMRHTFISMTVGAFRSVGDASLQAGNSEAVIRKHYLDLKSVEEADVFWGIVPAGDELPEMEKKDGRYVVPADSLPKV